MFAHFNSNGTNVWQFFQGCLYFAQFHSVTVNLDLRVLASTENQVSQFVEVSDIACGIQAGTVGYIRQTDEFCFILHIIVPIAICKLGTADKQFPFLACSYGLEHKACVVL